MKPFSPVDFDRAPFLAIWEVTRSCGLACSHCRASAILKRDPLELTTEEGCMLLDQVADLKTPLVILSGGDPLNREDLEGLIGHAKNLGLRVGTIPAATSNVTAERMRRLKLAGVDQVAFSLDGPTPELHDRFRGVPGSFAKTLEGAALAHQAGLPLQINTCFAAWNFSYLEAMISLVRSLDVVFWEVFFLIPIGRGQELVGLTADQFEMLFERIHRLSGEVSFIIKLTEAQHYRRFILRNEKSADEIRHVLARPRGANGGLGLSPQAVNSGKGFVFIDHVGNICPSGFLPISAGNIRRDSLADVYRHSPIFKELRDPSLLKGKCGDCEFRSACGGSRARAYAVTGDYLAADSSCAYTPSGARAGAVG